MLVVKSSRYCNDDYRSERQGRFGEWRHRRSGGRHTGPAGFRYRPDPLGVGYFTNHRVELGVQPERCSRLLRVAQFLLERFRLCFADTTIEPGGDSLFKIGLHAFSAAIDFKTQSRRMTRNRCITL